jgi:hypothetical protein
LNIIKGESILKTKKPLILGVVREYDEIECPECHRRVIIFRRNNELQYKLHGTKSKKSFCKLSFAPISNVHINIKIGEGGGEKRKKPNNGLLFQYS